MFGFTKPVLGGTKRMTETTGASGGGAVGTKTGIMECTKIATDIGWRAIGAVAVGDQVLTFDNGLQVVKSVRRTPVWSGDGTLPRHFWPMEVPADALGNSHTMHILPNQPVMVESDSADDCYGDPFALVPAAALEGLLGVHAVAMFDAGDVITLEFEDDQVVFAMCGGLFFCKAGGDIVADLFKAPIGSAYKVLDMARATNLMALIKDEIETASHFDFRPFALAA